MQEGFVNSRTALQNSFVADMIGSATLAGHDDRHEKESVAYSYGVHKLDTLVRM